MLRGTVAACCALSLVLAGAGIAAASAGFTDTELYSSSATNIYGSVASAFDARGGDILSMFGSDGTNGGAWVWQGNNPANSSGTGVFTLPSWASGAEIAYGMNGSGTIVVGRAYASPGSTVTPFAYTIGSASNSAADLGAYDANPATGASNSGALVFSDAQYLLPGGAQAFALPGGTGQQAAGRSTMSGNGTIAGVTSMGIPEIWTPITAGGAITGYNSPTVFASVAAPFSGGGAPGAAMNVNDGGNAVGSYMFWGSGNAASAPALFSGSGGSSADVFPLSPYTTITVDSDLGQANAVNSNGAVIGWDTFGGAYGTGAASAHAFIWTPNAANGTVGTFRDLNALYQSILPAGVVLNDTLGINDRGDILCLASGGTLHARELVLISQPALPGDANGDGKVDINDLTIVLAHFGQTGATWSQGEFTGDGTVDINDLTIVLAHFGQTAAGGAAAGPVAVPEPDTLAILAAGLAGLLAVVAPKRKKRPVVT